jgi:hypothetical protein
MKKQRKIKRVAADDPPVVELLLTRDGRILVHNLTATVAELLTQLDPGNQQLRWRTTPSKLS